MGLLQVINQNYASLIACLISLIVAIITGVYVVFTHRQMKAAQASVEVMRTEVLQRQQPCLVPIIQRMVSYPALTNGRRQMNIRIDVENIGDAPALSVYCISYLILQHTVTKDGGKFVDMFTGPNFNSCIKVGDCKTVDLHYENKQIDYMFEDLEFCMAKNWLRIAKTPTQHHYRGTEAIVQILYKNMAGQWFESKLATEIAWATTEESRVSVPGNINENTYPPRKITNKDKFEIHFVSEAFSPLSMSMVDEEFVKNCLIRYKDKWPDIFREIENYY